MKTFQFESIWLLSRRDLKARVVQFHPKKNLIVGRNHTGKSSLIKTLFRTLGARPQGELAQWDENTISVVDFKIGETRYRALHQSGYRSLFDSNGNILVAASAHNDWTTAFADAIGFNLVLTDRNIKTVPADPRCFFLPFYINQDGSWQSKWDTFVGLQQYSKPTMAVLEYFSGIKPPEYYELSSKRTKSQRELDDLQKEQGFLSRARDRLNKSMPMSGPKVRPENFEHEIAALTSEITLLNSKQESMRELAVRENEVISSIRLQINLANDALKTYECDSEYLRSEPRETLICPTCNAEHKESFLEILNYAEDARVLRELIVKLQDDLSAASEKHMQTMGQLSELDDNYRRVSGILNTRRGDLLFADVVSSLGAENAFEAFEIESSALKEEIDKRLSSIQAMDAGLKKLTNPKRSKEILRHFREAYASALISLNLPPIEMKKIKLGSRPDLSGSGGPRSILAYYGALWQVCFWQYAEFAVPLVIDSPNQQGQDDLNLPRVLKYIANDLPAEAQVIVGTEMETDHVFDQRIAFDQPYQLLRSDEYNDVRSVIDPLVEAMYAALQEMRSSSLI